MQQQGQKTSVQHSQTDAPYDEEEKIFNNKHRLASWGSSSLFGFASASYFAALATFGARFIAWSEQIATNRMKIQAGEILKPWEEAKLFNNKKTPFLLVGMVAFGSACMFFSNWLETKKTILEWRMGGSKIGNKIGAAASQTSAEIPADANSAPDLPQDLPHERADGKSWVEASRSNDSKKDYTLAV